VKAQNIWCYYITFIGDVLRYGHVYLISHKSEALGYFQLHLAEAEKTSSKSVKTLRTDYGREYLSDQIKELCEQREIVWQLATQTSQQNGVVERRNKTLIDMV